MPLSFAAGNRRCARYRGTEETAAGAENPRRESGKEVLQGSGGRSMQSGRKTAKVGSSCPPRVGDHPSSG